MEHLSIQIKVAANPIRTAEFRKRLNAEMEENSRRWNKYMYNAPTVRSIKRSGTYKNSARNTAFPMPLQFTNMDGKNVCERNDVMLDHHIYV